MVKLEEQWAETLAILFLVIGFIISVSLNDSLFSYLSLLLAGFIGGRIYYIKRYRGPIFPLILIIVGFLFGYLTGSFWINRFFAILFFVIGFVISYYLHLKEILVIFKSENFLK